MGITPKFTPNDVKRMFQKRIHAIDRVMIRQLLVLGEKCVNLARSLNTYQDDTGNLRGSIGYVIYTNKKPVGENFDNIQGGEKGKALGKELAARKAALYPAYHYVLVIVAGMDYALHVEAMGYDVLTPAEHLAEREFPKLMTKLMDKIDRAA